MKPSQDIKPVTYMKTHSADLLKEVNKRRHPIVITQNGEARAVILDINSYEKQKETTLMLKLVAQGESDIKSRRFMEQSKLFARLDKKLGLA